MQIECREVDVGEILKVGTYKVPDFQRPYSWEKNEIEEFWDDVIKNEDSDYFIGSMVLYENTNVKNQFYIVDGQQRLTTIILLLCSIRNAFTSFNLPDLALGLHGLIETSDTANKKNYVFSPDGSFPYFIM